MWVNTYGYCHNFISNAGLKIMEELNVPVDILFARKASKLVESAGLDPRLIDLEKFRQMAHIIFCRVYYVLYQERPEGFIDDPKTQDDFISNSQSFLTSLISRTHSRDLLDLTGLDICFGSYKAIAQIVDLLFSEGQRIWLERHGEIAQNENIVEETRLQEEDKPKPRRRRPKSASSTSSSKKGKIKAIGNYYDEILGQKDRESSPKNKIRPSSAGINRGRKLSPDDMDDIPIDLDEADEDLVTNIRPDKRETITGMKDRLRAQRPSSAPSSRKIRHVSVRLYNPASYVQANKLIKENVLSKDEFEKQRNSPPKPRVDTLDFGEKFTYDIKSGRRIPLVDRIRNAAAPSQTPAIGVDSLEEKVKASSCQRRPSSPISSCAPAYPGRSIGRSSDDWVRRHRENIELTPSSSSHVKPFRVAKSVEHAISSGSSALPLEEVLKKYLKPVVYSFYSSLEPWDMLISIEHCHHCQHHNFSLRHDENEYVRKSEAFLQSVVMWAHQCRLAIRVGVIRFPAPLISETSCPQDQDTRIGAFEIQVAWKSIKSELVIEVLHSKLATRRWPSKSVLEKRFRAWVLQKKIPTLRYSVPESGAMANDSVTPSFIPFDDLAISQSHWRCSWVGGSDDVMNNRNIASEAWIYDCRTVEKFLDIGDLIKVHHTLNPRSHPEHLYFSGSVQSTLLSTTELPRGVRIYPTQSDSSTSANPSYYKVQLRYEELSVFVPAENCLPIALFHTSIKEQSNSAVMPLVLDVFFYYLARASSSSSNASSFHWKKVFSEDLALGSQQQFLRISRRSFFQQCRMMVAQIEDLCDQFPEFSDHQYQDFGLIAVPLDVQRLRKDRWKDNVSREDAVVLLQLCYDEATIDWIFTSSGLEVKENLLSIFALMQLAPSASLFPAVVSSKSILNPPHEQNESSLLKNNSKSVTFSSQVIESPIEDKDLSSSMVGLTSSHSPITPGHNSVLDVDCSTTTTATDPDDSAKNVPVSKESPDFVKSLEFHRVMNKSIRLSSITLSCASLDSHYPLSVWETLDVDISIFGVGHVHAIPSSNQTSSPRISSSSDQGIHSYKGDFAPNTGVVNIDSFYHPQSDNINIRLSLDLSSNEQSNKVVIGEFSIAPNLIPPPVFSVNLEEDWKSWGRWRCNVRGQWGPLVALSPRSRGSSAVTYTEQLLMDFGDDDNDNDDDVDDGATDLKTKDEWAPELAFDEDKIDLDETSKTVESSSASWLNSSKIENNTSVTAGFDLIYQALLSFFPNASPESLAETYGLNWMKTTPLSEWQCLEVNADANTVVGLSLYGLSLGIPFPSQIVVLSDLVSLDLHENKMTGPIIDELGTLSSLTRLNLSANQFTGALPSSFSKLTRLRSLDLSNNQLSGVVPDSFGSMISLESLLLVDNMLWGPLPLCLSKLPHLVSFLCDFCPYTSSMDRIRLFIMAQSSSEWEWPMISSLSEEINCIADEKNVIEKLYEKLFLSQKSKPSHSSSSLLDLEMEEDMEEVWQNWKSESPLFSWKGIHLNKSLQIESLVLRQRFLSGSWPSSLDSLGSLIYLDLGENGLQGSLPSSWQGLSNLRYCLLDHNRIDSEGFDDIFPYWTDLKVLDLSYCHISGTVPSSIMELSSLENLSLNDNDLSGKFVMCVVGIYYE